MKNTFIIVVLLFFVGAMADNFNITSVNINNTACGSTLYPGGHIDVIWQTSNQTAAGQASCYVSVRRAANVSEILLGNQIGSQAPCNQGFLSINITSSPMNLTAWNHLRVIAMVNEVAPSSGHNDSCSFVWVQPSLFLDHCVLELTTSTFTLQNYGSSSTNMPILPMQGCSYWYLCAGWNSHDHSVLCVS